jgi:hypothetical protein
MTVTVFFSFRDRSGEPCWRGSKLALDGDGRKAGDVFDRVRVRGRASDVVDAMPECRVGVCGKSEKAGDFMGCGEVALRGRVLSSFSILSLMVLSFSRVAWRRSSREDLVPFGFSTPLNMTLYRSNLMSGMSTLRSPRPPAVTEGRGSEMVAQLGSSTTMSGCGSGCTSTMMGLCFGALLPPTVLLLAGRASALETGAGKAEVLRSVSTGAAALGGSACFLPPNSEPKSLLFCVLVLWILGSAVDAGEGVELMWTDVCGCHPACGPLT